MPKLSALSVAVWGVRGSHPVARDDTRHFGGNTTCFAVHAAGNPDPIVVDMGTGFIELGRTFQPQRQPLNILLTHTHNDHLEGMRFSRLMNTPGAVAVIYGPPRQRHVDGGRELRQAIEDYFDPTYFPAALQLLATQVGFIELRPDVPFSVGGVTVTPHEVKHKNQQIVTFGYRFDFQGQSLAIIPDHELGLNAIYPETDLVQWLARPTPVNLLLHDAQYTEPEYEKVSGFGHSTPDQVQALAKAIAKASRAAAPSIYTVHHDPQRSDTEVEEMATRIGARAAAEATVIDIWGHERRLSEPGRGLAE